MTWRDTIQMAVHNLLQRRGRSVLNLLGVVIGCTMLLMAAAGGQGVVSAIERLFERSEYTRQIFATVDHSFGQAEIPEDAVRVDGEMSDARRKRIRETLEQEYRSKHQSRRGHGISSDQLDALEKMAHVIEVIPVPWMGGVVSSGGSNGFVEVEGTSMIGDLKDRLAAGSLPTKIDDALIDDVTAWKLGYVNDAELEDLVGKRVTLTLQNSQTRALGVLASFGGSSEFGPDQFLKQIDIGTALVALLADLDSTSLTDEQKKLIRDAVGSLSAMTQKTSQTTTEPEGSTGKDPAVVQEFTICGVYEPGQGQNLWKLFRQHVTGRSNGFLMSAQTVRRLMTSTSRQEECRTVLMTVNHTQHLQEVTDSAKAIGLRPHSALRIIKSVKEGIGQSLLVIYGIAGVILMTTCLGICNTLFVSILERTPEFGIMKSLGAEDRHIRRLMLCEGALLGAAGAGVSVVISWLLGMVGDGLLRRRWEVHVNDSLDSGVFQLGFVSIALVTLLSIFICVMASLIPAIRASRLDPVVAMRRQ